MKKTLLLTIALVLSTVLFSQTFVDESFNGSELPNGWSTSENGASNWMISATTYSGGDGNELKLAEVPAFEGITRLITTPFNLSNVDEMTVSFKHLFTKSALLYRDSNLFTVDIPFLLEFESSDYNLVGKSFVRDFRSVALGYCDNSR